MSTSEITEMMKITSEDDRRIIRGALGENDAAFYD